MPIPHAMNLRHLLLAAGAHLAIAALAQEGGTRTTTRNIDVRSENGESTVTITTTENGVTTTQTFTGDEAKVWMAKSAGCCVAEAGDADKVVCMVVVNDGGNEGKVKGTTRAEVFRYRYVAKQKSTDSAPDAEVVIEMDDAEAAPAVIAVPDAGEVRTLEIPSDAFTFFPNPSNGPCTMRYELPGEGDALVTIVDPLGREVYNERISGSGPQTRTIDLTGKGPGEFIARLAQGGVTLLKKLVIE